MKTTKNIKYMATQVYKLAEFIFVVWECPVPSNFKYWIINKRLNRLSRIIGRSPKVIHAMTWFLLIRSYEGDISKEKVNRENIPKGWGIWAYLDALERGFPVGEKKNMIPYEDFEKVVWEERNGK